MGENCCHALRASIPLPPAYPFSAMSPGRKSLVRAGLGSWATMAGFSAGFGGIVAGWLWMEFGCVAVGSTFRHVAAALEHDFGWFHFVIYYFTYYYIYGGFVCTDSMQISLV